MHILSIIRIIGILIMCFSITMLTPAFVALIYGDGGGKAFMQSFIISLTVGAGLWWSCHKHKQKLHSREGFLIVVAFWVVLSLLGVIPFMMFEETHLTFPDAVFESFSALTTTGATVISGLDQLPKSILFYRQFLQWIGGMGLIVLAVAIIPLLGIGGTHLYRAESSGPLKDQKTLPRIAEIAKLLWILYLGLTVLCALAYYWAGMDLFDALSHSFATVSNGGMSTHDMSMGYFNNSKIYLLASIFMLIAGCNFALHITALVNIGRRPLWKTYFRDPEFRFFLTLQLVFICIVAVSFYFYYDLSMFDAFAQGMFQLTSMSMTAGFTLYDMEQVPAFIAMLLVFSAILGGCAGSTSGGLKSIRVLVMWLQVKRELKHLVHPNLVIPIKLGHSILAPRVIEGIWSFLMAFLIIYWICVFGVILCGLEPFDAMGAVLATLTNVGPGIGSTGMSFTHVPDSAKYILAFAMVCGRLEVFSLIVLFSPAFWKT
ncbi:trk system potassium uptake protein TrkH [Mesocricetibacter intestinalis]|uniref:Trk system potassium uptake protein n=1 Tax=Mesocricetibacter intestinalis TaxID=1521930 RepID=A0A4R6V6Y0_9PAST|nr:TrkH family potassium uptake protein [Mesocricetibacter intestinalis]TDQ56756.1 trk system potassium uptake protein TrkH [Mesocricetibacter intestinalis]